MIKINNIIVLITASLIALFLSYLSFDSGKSAAYLLPRTYSVILVGIVATLIILHVRKKNEFYKELNLKKIFPTIIFIVLFILFGEELGFYFSTTLIFFFITTFYSPGEKNIKSLIKAGIICSLFMCFIYVLFSLMLKVQVPEFILFSIANS